MSPALAAVAIAIVGAISAALWSGQSLAQSATPLSDTDLSKEAENPVTRQVTLPLRYEADFLDGPYKATKDTFEIDQAVVPFRLNEDWALITRTKLPAIVQPPKNLGDHWAAGLSNGYTTFFLSPEHGEGFYWGVGPVLYYPTATNSTVGVNKWGSGPSVAFVKKDESPWVFGAVVNNVWSFGGPAPSSDRTNQLLLNPLRQLSFRRRMVCRLIAKHDPELAGVWKEVDRPDWRRRRQSDPAGRAARQTVSRQLLQRHTAQGGQRDVAAAIHDDLCVFELTGRRRATYSYPTRRGAE
jgi:hypothetical protein